MYTMLHRFKQLILIAAGTTVLTVVGFSAAGVASAAASIYRPVAVPSAATIPANASLPELRATYSTIDYPGAIGTTVTGVTRTGRLGQSIEVVGTYADGRGNIQDQHGFVLSGGHYTSLNFPGGAGTRANGINARGQVVGAYYNPNVQGWCSPLFRRNLQSHLQSLLDWR